MSCKSKDAFNILRSKEAQTPGFVVAMRNAAVFVKSMNCALWCIVISIVLLPCLIEPLPAFGNEERHKIKDGETVLVESALKEFGGISIVPAKRRVQGKKLIFESRSEFSSGVIELLPVQNPDSVGVGFLNKLDAGTISEMGAKGGRPNSSKGAGDHSQNSDRFGGHDEVSFMFIIMVAVGMIVCPLFGIWLGWTLVERFVYSKMFPISE